VASIIQRIGLRYQPNSLDALDDHRGKIALLIGDVDGIVPPDLLERACGSWALKSPYMPKASDLIALATEIANPVVTRTTTTTIAERVAYANSKLATGDSAHRATGKDAIEWFDDNGQLKLRYVQQRAN
jgi:hypothetical protein